MHMKINNYAINLINSKQPPYRPIYSLKLVELKTLKTFIKTNLANNFIKSFKLLVNAFIFFVKKPNSNFQLFVNY